MKFWTNPSVLALSRGHDPIEVITQKSRAVVFEALESGWEGPPYDPFRLADQMGVKITPSSDVREARTIPLSDNRFRIEFNPDRPQRRIRYSIFHELAHTLFPDCGDTIRNRGTHTGARPDDWQLETLCNLARPNSCCLRAPWVLEIVPRPTTPFGYKILPMARQAQCRWRLLGRRSLGGAASPWRHSEEPRKRRLPTGIVGLANSIGRCCEKLPR